MKIAAKTMMNTAIALAAAALLAGCVVSIGGSDAERIGETSCKAQAYQSLIGQEASAINRADLPKAFRIVCAGCPMTMDYRPDRLTLQLDQANRVESAKCG